MSKSANLQILLDNFMNTVPDLLTALVIDYNGFIIAKNSQKNFDDELIGGITTLLDQTLNRIKSLTKSEHGSGSFNIDHFRLFYIQLGKSTGALLVLIGDTYSHLDYYIPYSHIIADKVSLTLSHHEVPCNIPIIDEEAKLLLNPKSKNLMIIGSQAVGKSALVRKLCSNDFTENYYPTIGVCLIEKHLKIENNNECIINVFDLASLKSFGKVRRYFLNYSDGILIMFDYSREDSLHEVEDWITEARQFVQNKDLPIAIVGNKSDLNANKEIMKQKAEKLAKDNNCRFFEISVLTGEGVGTMLGIVTRQLFLNNENKKLPLKSDKETDRLDNIRNKLASL